jgi:L-threonylcarbamoyladenylate synthase
MIWQGVKEWLWLVRVFFFLLRHKVRKEGGVLQTKVWSVAVEKPEEEIIAKAVQIIKQGGLVAFPTETVYGLGADGFNETAVQRIFRVKKRPLNQALILHLAEKADLEKLAFLEDERAWKLAHFFWPGPLTLVLPKREVVPEIVSGGLTTVGLRMPNHPVALALIRAVGVPLAAPSANCFGRPSPTKGEHVLQDLGGKIEAILEAGSTSLGLESTVLDLSQKVPLILRSGAISKEELELVLGKVDRKEASIVSESGCPLKVIFLKGNAEKKAKYLSTYLAKKPSEKIALLLTTATWDFLGEVPTVFYQRDLGNQLEQIAPLLYEELRNCEAQGIEVVFTEAYEEKGWGRALMSRLLKFTQGQIQVIE